MKRTGNHNHYENAVEAYFHKNQISYLAINEGKKVLANNQKVKNFDFLVSSPKKIIVALDVKGKQFGYKSAPKNLWENWVLEQDIIGLQNWQKQFKKNFLNINPVFMYAYQIKDKEHEKLFEVTFKFKSKLYGFVGISLNEYIKHSKVRSNSPRTVSISRRVFSEIVKPITHFF